MFRKINILLVDDIETWAIGAVDSLNEDYGQILHADFFSIEHRKAMNAATLGDALVGKLLSARNDNTKMPDVLIIDYSLDGMNGLYVIKELKNNGIDIPVLLMTAHAEQMMEEVVESLEIGARGYLFKNPINVFYRALSLTVKRVFQEDQTKNWLKVMIETLAGSLEINSVQKFSRFFIEKIKKVAAVEKCFIRKYDVKEQNLELLECEGIPAGVQVQLRIIKSYDVPFLNNLFAHEKKKVQIVNDLRKEQSEWSIQPLIKGLGLDRVLSGRIGTEENPLGSISLFRSNIDAPFSQSDGQYFALLLSHLENVWQSLEQQKHDAEVIDSIYGFSKCKDIDDVFSILVRQLHKEINKNDNSKTKITIKQLRPGTDRLAVIDKEKHHLGIDRTEEFEPRVNDTSISSRAFREKTSILLHDVNQAPDFHFTNPNVRSALTVPVVLSGTTAGEKTSVGVVNMESTGIGFYKDNQQKYAETLSQLAASHAERLMIKNFNESLVTLIGETGIEKRIDKTINLIKEFTGYQVFLMVLADPQKQKKWIIANSDGLPEAIKAQYIREIEERINQEGIPTTHIGYCLNVGEEVYIYDRNKQESTFWQREDMNNISQDVHLLRAGDQIIGAMSLEFNISDPLSRYQRNLLGCLANWLGNTFLQLDTFKALEIEVLSAAQVFLVHHVITNDISSVNNRIRDIEGLLKQKKDYSSIQNKLHLLKEKMEEINLLPKKLKAVMLDKPELTTVNVSAAWEDACNFLLEKLKLNKVRLSKPSCDGYSVYADRQILIWIFFNLIDNAINEFTKNPDLQNRNIQFSCTKGIDDYIQIIVDDNGPGFSIDIQHAMKKGVTTSPSGLGRGLPWIKDKIKLLNGDIVIRNKDRRQGSIVTLRLPMGNIKC